MTSMKNFLSVLALVLPAAAQAAPPDEAAVRHVVDAAVAPVMDAFAIPGMAIGISVDGRSQVLDYGLASTATRKPVDASTLFELGSISKTFTATLAAWAEAQGRLSLDEKVATYLPAMQGRPFGQVRLVDLATHTAGGFPLQVPDEVEADPAKLDGWLAAWKPAYPAGTQRSYANPSIGMLGAIAARRLDMDFGRAMEDRLFPALGLKHSFVDLPASARADLALGTSSEGKPINLKGGVLGREAYGMRATAGDVLRFVEAQLGQVRLEAALKQAIATTRTARYQAGPMTQDLVWEQYLLPVGLPALLEGNGQKMILETTPVKAVSPTLRSDVWVNKTGSTNGFGNYVAFIPVQRLGIVILANRNYPITERVKLAHRILTALGADTKD